MRRYVIERDLPGVGAFSADQVRDASRASCDAVLEVGAGIQWEHSYLTGDRLYCIYLAENEHLVREHAKRAGLPANRVVEVKQILDPLSASFPGQ